MGTRRAIALSIAGGLACVGSVLLACGSDAASGFADGIDGGGSSGSSGNLGEGGSFGDAGFGAPFQANGLVLVHAAQLPAFRLCFEANKTLRPLPTKELMPESNVAGVEVGSAVRVDPIGPALGKVFLYEEPVIRPLYQTLEEGPTCDELLTVPDMKVHELGEITKDVSRGVHVLVVEGCLKAAEDPAASKARCGDTWTGDKGNLHLETISLSAYTRTQTDRLPVQVVQLSSALDSQAKGRDLSITFGSLNGDADGGDAGTGMVGATAFLGSLPFGVVVPQQPTPVNYDPDNTAAYASSGFRITLGGNVKDGGAKDAAAAAPAEILLNQSLADIGRLSSSRDVPPQWFAVASSYVLLVLGDPAAKAASSDAGADASAGAGADERKRLHLLAVPVGSPEEDEPSTTDAGGGDGGDGGKTPR